MNRQSILARAAAIAVAVVAAMSGCSTDRDPSELFAPDGVGTPVVQAAMLVGRAYPPVLLSRATAPDAPFYLTEVGIRDATVTIVDDQGITMTYGETQFGIYEPNAVLRVEANRTYSLRVLTDEGEVITATTTTPDTLRIDRWVLLDDTGSTIIRELRSFSESPDSVYYKDENQLVYAEGLLEARIQDLPVPAYQVGIFSLDESELVIDPDFLDEEDLDGFDRFISSPPLELINGALRLPWFAIYYAGRYKIRVYALDDNWFDLVRSVPELGGGPGFGGNVGDDFEKPIFHINGGIGLFGSASVDSIGFYVHPRE